MLYIPVCTRKHITICLDYVYIYIHTHTCILNRIHTDMYSMLTCTSLVYRSRLLNFRSTSILHNEKTTIYIHAPIAVCMLRKSTLLGHIPAATHIYMYTITCTHSYTCTHSHTHIHTYTYILRQGCDLKARVALPVASSV